KMCRQQLYNYCYHRAFEYLNAYYSVTECISHDHGIAPSVMIPINNSLGRVSCKLNLISAQFVFYPSAICVSLAILDVEQHEINDVFLSKMALMLSSIEITDNFSTQCSDSKLWLWWRFEYDFLSSYSPQCLANLLGKPLDTDTLNLFVQAGAIECALEQFISGLEMQRVLSECLKRSLLHRK
ncbi:MAG: hypothetical protein ACRCUL_00235, partial [Plesiomonas sp.]